MPVLYHGEERLLPLIALLCKVLWPLHWLLRLVGAPE